MKNLHIMNHGRVGYLVKRLDCPDTQASSSNTNKSFVCQAGLEKNLPSQCCQCPMGAK